MPENTRIEWTRGDDGEPGATWNPVTGCTKVSPGCAHCYAEAFARRWRGIPGHPYEQGFDLRIWESRLALPFTWRKHRRIFVNSMSDLFHEKVPDSFVRQVFDSMVRADWHDFLVLTKRPQRLVELAPDLPWPPNVWVGVTIENNRWVERADLLRQVPAAVRFISAEPLLSPLPNLDLSGIDWLIAGGESGPRHRRPQVEWFRDLRDRCVEDEVAFFFKQWGGRSPKANGRVLDGREWSEMPVPVERWPTFASPTIEPKLERALASTA